MNGGRFIEFLKALIKSVAAEKIFLIVDGSSIHKSKKVKAFLEKDEIRDCLELFFLPGYSPELNPDEWVWNNVKNTRLGRKYSEIVWLPMGRIASTSTNADRLTGLPNTYTWTRGQP